MAEKLTAEVGHQEMSVLLELGSGLHCCNTCHVAWGPRPLLDKTCRLETPALLDKTGRLGIPAPTRKNLLLGNPGPYKTKHLMFDVSLKCVAVFGGLWETEREAATPPRFDGFQSAMVRKSPSLFSHLVYFLL